MRKLQLVVMVVVSGCKASAVLDGYSAAKLNMPENATKWAQFSSAPAIHALSGADLSTERGDCPSSTDDGTTRTFKGGCTTDAGVHYFGSATVVRTMNQPKDLVVTLTFAGLGTETPTTCGSATVTTKQTITGTVIVTNSDFTVDERIEQERYDIDDCNNAVKETFAFDYVGSDRYSWNGKGRVGSSLLGTANVETKDEVLNDSVCSSEAASGTTTLKSGNDVLTITYDGMTKCDSTSNVKWNLNGEDKGELVGVRCAVSPAVAMVMLVPLLIRRRRARTPRS